MRNSTPIEKYIELADGNNLEIYISASPNSIRTPIIWKCKLCGREMMKSYHKIKYSENVCRCRSALDLKIDDYLSLAQLLGLQWMDRILPRNIHVSTYWKSKEGKIFSASYHELGYNKIPNRLKVYLEKS